MKHLFSLIFFFSLIPVLIYSQNEPASVKIEKNELYINSIPEGAAVYINDTLAGTTPLIILNITPYNKKLRLTKTGFKDWEMNIFSYGTETKQITALLDDTHGEMVITSEPLHAEVFLNDTLIGVTPLERVKMRRGIHNLKIKKQGYQEWEQLINSRGVLQYISADLQSSVGYIRFNERLNSGSLLVDGKTFSIEPSVNKSLSVGPHEITYIIPGSERELNEEINVRPDSLYVFRMESNSIKPVLYSFFIPGTGQISNGSYFKGFSILAATIAAGIFTFSSISNYNDKQDAADDALLFYQNSSTEDLALYYRGLVEQTQADADDALLLKRISIGTLLGIYIYNLIDILLFEDNDYLKINISKLNNTSDLGALTDIQYNLNLSIPLK